MKLIRTVTISACMLLFIAVLLCIISDMTGPSPSIVYAEQETDQMDVQSVPGIHAGLEGMFSGIECVRSYDYDLQAKYTEIREKSNRVGPQPGILKKRPPSHNMQQHANGGRFSKDARYDPTRSKTCTNKRMNRCVAHFPWGQDGLKYPQ